MDDTLMMIIMDIINSSLGLITSSHPACMMGSEGNLHHPVRMIFTNTSYISCVLCIADI